MTLNVQSAPVFAHLVPHANRLRRIMLPQHLHPPTRARQPVERGLIRPRLDHIATLIDRPKDRGIAFDHPPVFDAQGHIWAAEFALQPEFSRLIHPRFLCSRIHASSPISIFGNPSNARFSASLRNPAADTRRHCASRSAANAGT